MMHGLAVQMHAFGERMASLGLDEKWLVREGKVAVRRGEIKSGAPAVPRSQTDEPPPHAVPADFDADLIGPVDASSKETALASLVEAIAQRWMTLHEQAGPCQPQFLCPLCCGVVPSMNCAALYDV